MEQVTTLFEKKCAACEKKKSAELKLQKCSRCTSVRYCSVACQKQDWKAHKPRCQEIAARQDADAAGLKDLFDLGLDLIRAKNSRGIVKLVTDNLAL